MYAVIATGGKQVRVVEGNRYDIEKVPGAEGDEVTFSPVLVVDGEATLATRTDLVGASVAARIVGATKGPKIRGLVYQSKARRRRHWGHRQNYTTIEITSISKG